MAKIKAATKNTEAELAAIKSLTDKYKITKVGLYSMSPGTRWASSPVGVSTD